MDSCPKCRRKLLSHASVNCNWCGHEIEDAQYQRQAAAERAAYYADDRLDQTEELAAVEAMNPLPLVGIFTPKPRYSVSPSPFVPRAHPLPPIHRAEPLPARECDEHGDPLPDEPKTQESFLEF